MDVFCEYHFYNSIFSTLIIMGQELGKEIVSTLFVCLHWSPVKPLRSHSSGVLVVPKVTKG